MKGRLGCSLVLGAPPLGPRPPGALRGRCRGPLPRAATAGPSGGAPAGRLRRAAKIDEQKSSGRGPHTRNGEHRQEENRDKRQETSYQVTKTETEEKAPKTRNREQNGLKTKTTRK